MALGGHEVDGAQSPQHGLPDGQVGLASGASSDRSGQAHEPGGLGEFGQGGGPEVVHVGRPLHCGQGRRVNPIEPQAAVEAGCSSVYREQRPVQEHVQRLGPQ